MNFGEALEAVKEGKSICRPGWNGKGMYVKLQKSSHSAFRDYLEMKDAQGKFVPWVASQTDVLAEDWYIE